ncbi:unnamed protein product [Rotaria sp. Silwood2]|nr:unnamed protein product [Rotaria sp. Silwood2]
MPMKRGHVSAPQNTFIDTIIRKFDSQNRRFLISNAQLVNKPIIYCNDAFCDLIGYSRADIIQKACTCEFLYGAETSEKAAKQIRHALQGSDEKEVDIILYKNNGIHKRSWLHMLNPLARHKSNQSNDTTTGGTSEFEGPTATDRADYIGLNHKNTTTISLDETILPTPKNLPLDYKSSRKSSTSSNNLLKPDNSLWNTDINDIELMKSKSQSLSNIAETVLKKEKKESKNIKRSFIPNRIAQILSLGEDIVPDFRSPDTRRIPRTIILHYSPFKASWDWLILLLVIYTAIVTPYTAAFLMHEDGPNKQRSRSSRALNVIELIVDVMFIIDLLVNLRTTYVKHNEELVTRASKIAKHYLKGWFLIDVTAAIPFDILFSLLQTNGGGESTTLMGLLKTARLLRLVRIARKLDRYSEYGVGVLILLTATFALIAHWLACIWYAIGRLERSNQGRILRKKAYVTYFILGNERLIGWLAELANHTHQYYNDSDPTSGPTKTSKYITALYFTFSSLTSVGFGNLIVLGSRITWLDELARISGQPYNCSSILNYNKTTLTLMYASIFGNVSAIIQRLYSGTARYQIQMLRVKEFIRFHQIPNPLRQRLEDYFNHAWNYTNGIDMNMVLKGFPECLQADICLHLNSQLLKNCPAFKDASEGCLRTFSMKFKTTHAPPGDIITHRGDILTSLYFISRGSIEILKDDKVVAILSKDDILGENPVLYSEPGKSAFNVRALTYCDLHKILRDDLLEVIDMYPEFAQSFCQNLKITLTLRDEDLVAKSNECRSKYLPSQQQYRGSSNRTDDDNTSLMGPQFDEYPSGAGFDSYRF